MSTSHPGFPFPGTWLAAPAGRQDCWRRLVFVDRNPAVSAVVAEVITAYHLVSLFLSPSNNQIHFLSISLSLFLLYTDTTHPRPSTNPTPFPAHRPLTPITSQPLGSGTILWTNRCFRSGLHGRARDPICSSGKFLVPAKFSAVTKRPRVCKVSTLVFFQVGVRFTLVDLALSVNLSNTHIPCHSWTK